MFYSLPYVEQEYGVLKRPNLKAITSYELNDAFVSKDKSKELVEYLYATIGELPNANERDKAASKESLEVLNTLSQYDPMIKHYIEGFIDAKPQPLTNGDVNTIIGAYIEGR